MRMPHTAALLSLVPLLGLMTGCGDPLVSGTALDDLLGLAPNLEAAAWEVRWVTPDGLELDCQLREVEVELEDDDAALGSVELEMPEDLASTARFNEVDDGAWALALITLVDTDLYTAPAFTDVGASLELEDGVWGAVAPEAVLFLDGDVEAVGEQLWLDPDEVRVTDSELLVTVLAELAEADEAIEGTLEPVSSRYVYDDEEEEEGGRDRDDGEDGELDALTVTEREQLSEAEVAVWSGEALGGAWEGCR